MSTSQCPFYKGLSCAIKKEVDGIDAFRASHNCDGVVSKCSFFTVAPQEQQAFDLPIKILIAKVSNPYLVKADALLYPTNNLLEIDDSILNRMTKGQLQPECDKRLRKGVKMGYPYQIEVKPNWSLKQKYFFNLVVAGESRLVSEESISSAIKKSFILLDAAGAESLVMTPCDYGTHDIIMTAIAQISAIYKVIKSMKLENIKKVYICMTDEESHQTFIEYYNRIFSGAEIGVKQSEEHKEG